MKPSWPSGSLSWLAPAPPAVVAAGFLVLYGLLDWLSFVHPMRGTTITAWNPQAALSLALLTRYPGSGWLVAAALTLTAASRALPGPVLPAMTASLATTVGFVFTALALRRVLGPLPRITTRKAYLGFLLIAAIGSALLALLYVGTLAAVGFEARDRLLAAFLRRWIGDGVSVIVSLPVVLVLADRVRQAETLAMLRSVEWWLVAAAAMAAAYAVFGLPAQDPFKLFYALFLPVAWGAARFGHVGAVWSAALVQALLFAAVQGTDYRPLTVFELHMLMAALGATGLLLGATVEEQQHAERALRASLHAAAAADMAAALAHELNQPLTAMRTYARAAQVMAQQPPSADRDNPRAELQDVTTRLVAEVTRAGAVVRRLRDFFRQRGTELQPTDIDELIRDVMAAQALHAQASGVDLCVETLPGLPPAWIDRVQIEVVLRNLVANAIDAAAQAAGAAPRVVVSASVKGNRLQVQVVDSGPGLQADELAAVFDSRPSSKPGGMGIGLVISRSIIEAHEGNLWAEAGPGGRFAFSIPLAEAAPA